MYEDLTSPEAKKVKKRVWMVKITIPQDEANRWQRNKDLGVLASDIVSAIEAVKKEYPTATIWSANHSAPLHITT